MNKFKLEISSPDGTVFSDEILKITLRGANGDLAIMAGHIPFITSVKKGQCRVLIDENNEKTAKLDGGMLTVAKDKVTLLSGSFSWS